MVRADAHDLGAQGLELRQGRLEGLEFLGSRRGKRRDERVDDDRALRRQVGELDGLAVDAVQREVGGLLPDLEGARPTGERDTDQRRRHDSPEQRVMCA